MPDYTQHQEEIPFDAMLDAICSELVSGSLWHERAAQSMLKGSLRGFARMHAAQAKHDQNKRLCLEKITVDRIGRIPALDLSEIPRTAAYEFPAGKLKEHLRDWAQNEDAFINMLNEAVRISVTVDMAIYEELCRLLSDVQEEVSRVKMLYGRLEMGGWSGQDLGAVSLLLHKHYESSDGWDWRLS